ncbi:unnamed protein product [Coregonus sp. 'balchen']|nr:unnamed protein product [Coregonus sp. 'balchen']
MGGERVKRGIERAMIVIERSGETREDRTKRLFRHYTVGSYDNLSSYREVGGGERKEREMERERACTREREQFMKREFLRGLQALSAGALSTRVSMLQDSYLLSLSSLLSSDYIIEEKNAMLQKKENEGFGFVLRGAKAETPIEEFTPTPAFPALQYLESVDVEGVAWRAGLRTGDFLIEVHGVNVVKVGHKQVVSLIRQGGNSLLMKCIKGFLSCGIYNFFLCQGRMAQCTPHRSVQWGGERECVCVCVCDGGKVRGTMKKNVSTRSLNKSSSFPQADQGKTVKTGWSLPFEGGEEGMALHGGLHPGMERAHMQLPRGMSRTKSFGATEEDRLSALAGEHHFPRSSSMTDSLRDHSNSHSIPPPPQTAPPPPPSLYYLDTGPPPAFCPPPPPARGHGQGHDPGGRSIFKPSSLDLDRPYDPSPRQSSHAERQKKARSMIILQDSSHLPVEPTDIPRPSASATPPERIKRKGRVIDNPYANVGQFSIGLYTPTKPQRKKSPLVKQLQVEDAQERASIALAAAHSRESSPSGRHTHTHGHTHTSRADYYQQQLMVERERMRLQGEALLQGKGPFAAAIAGAVKDRERRLEERRKSTVFLSVGTMEGGSGSVPEAPSYTTSRSIDERMLSREMGQLPPPALALRPSPGGTTFIHPLTGKPLDPNSPLALALAARERALTSQTQSPASSPEPRTKQDRAGAGAGGQGASLFIDSQTKEPQHGDGSPGSPQASKPQWGASSPALLRQEMEGRGEERKEERRTEDKKSMLISIMDTSQQKTAGLIMVHATTNCQAVGLEPGLEQTPTSPATEPSKPSLSRVPSPSPSASQPQPQPQTQPQPQAQHPSSPAHAPLAQGSSEEDVEPYTVSLPPAMLSSSDEDTREELKKIGVLPPPDEFANGLLAKAQALAQAQAQGTPVPQSKSVTSPTTPTTHTPLTPSTTTTPTPSLTPTSSLTPTQLQAPPFQPSPGGAVVSGKPSDPDQTHPPALLAESGSAADSGVEEPDTRSSSERERDHHLETTSTVSTVSSMSTLSSESGEPADTHTSYADGQTFVLDKPPVPPKPRLKSHIGGSKGPVTFRDPLLKQSSDSELLSQQQAAALAAAAAGGAGLGHGGLGSGGLGSGGLGSGSISGLVGGPGRPRYLFQRRSKLWGDQMEARGPGVGLGMGSLGSLGGLGLGLGLGSEEGGKPSVMGELSSRLQQLNKDTRSLGEEEPLGASLDPGRKSPVTGAR